MFTPVVPQFGVLPIKSSLPKVKWEERLESYGNYRAGVLKFIDSYSLENVGDSVLVEVTRISENG